ncbi:MAG TPA: hypothetical protein DHV83_08495 [Prevotella sp.]|nr:hypothetical protein [Prevotella sp.]
MHNSFIIPIFAKKQQKKTMEHITTKEQAMTWLMRNKKKKEERLEAMKAIAIKKYEERTGLKANYVETL